MGLPINDTRIPIGTLVDHRYLVQQMLGQGGLGRTYLVLDQRRFNERCVLKEFCPRNTSDYVVKKAQELFKREAETLYKLDHPQIPTFHAWFDEDDRLFLVQEFVDGQTYLQLLREREQQGYTFSEAEIIQWLKDVLPVLGYIHDRNIIHRDISPDNMMRPTGKTLPVLIDFGVAKLLEDQLSTIDPDDAPRSRPASIVGKVGYAPPEQILSGHCYPNSDLYALGVTALVLMTGKTPNELFDGYTLQWQWHEFLQPTAWFTQILEKMLARVPEHRYQSAEELLAVLDSSDQFVFDSAPSQSRLLDPTLPATTLNTSPQEPCRSSGNAATTAIPMPLEPTQSTPILHIAQPSAAKKAVHSAPTQISSAVISREGIRRQTIVWGVVLILGVTGVAIGVLSPHFSFLCQALNNCAAPSPQKSDPSPSATPSPEPPLW
jgi:serine/threonine-protein kinase